MSEPRETSSTGEIEKVTPYTVPPKEPVANFTPNTDTSGRRLVQIRTWLAQYDAPEARPEDVNVFSLPLNWESIRGLGSAASRVTGGISAQDFTEIRPPEELYPFLPMVTSVIAHHKYPEVPTKLPTVADIKTIKPWISTVEGFIGRFSPNLAHKFRGYVQSKGQNTVLEIGQKATGVLDTLEQIPNPQLEFMKEIHWAYHFLSQPSHDSSIEDRVGEFVSLLHSAKYGGYAREGQHWLTPKDFPLLLKLLPQLGIPPDELSERDASIAGAELMEGFEVFLRQHGITDIPRAPRPKEFDFFDPDTWMRGLAEAFAGEKLERVKIHLPNLLANALRAMPTDGPALANSAYSLSKSATDAYYQGVSPREIAKTMFDRKTQP